MACGETAPGSWLCTKCTLRNLKFDSRDHERRVRDVERHREVLRRNLATRLAARTNLEIMSSQRFPG